MLYRLGTGLRAFGAPSFFSPPSLPDNYITAPASSALSSKLYHAFGFDRLVEGYSGDTVRLKRLSDNTESDFGFNGSTGAFDMGSVDTWRSGADVDVVSFYDQSGNGASADANGTVEFVRSDVVQRFGTSWSSSNEELTRSTTQGGVGADLAGTGAIKISGTNIDVSGSGVEFAILGAMNTRKNVAGSDAYGGNNTTEYLFDYGTGNTLFYRHYFYSTFGTYGRFYYNGGTSDTDSGGKIGIYKKYAQFVMGGRLNSTRFETTVHNAEDTLKTMGAANQAAVAGGAIDDGILLIGAHFLDGSGNANLSSSADMIFGGVVMTQSLNDDERFFLQAKLGAVGQQHLIESIDTLKAYFDDIILLKDASASTGVATGINGKVSLSFNTGTVAEGTSTYVFNHLDESGVRGIQSPDSSQGNGFIASDSYFAGKTTGTIMSLHSLSVADANLFAAIEQSDNNGFSTSDNNRSLSLGFDHAHPSMMAKVADDKDPGVITGTRRFANGTLIGDQAGSGSANQAKGKYNRNTMHGNFDYPSTMNSYDYYEAAWRNEDPSSPLDIDAPTGHDVPQNEAFPYKAGQLLLQIATFEAPAGYNRADSAATREPYMLQSHNRSYLGMTGTTIGHVIGDTAINDYGAVVDSVDNAKLCSSHWIAGFQGTLCAFAFLPDTALTMAQVQKINVNVWKLFE